MPKNDLEKLKLEVNSIESTVLDKIQKLKDTTAGLEDGINKIVADSEENSAKLNEIKTRIADLDTKVESLKGTSDALKKKASDVETTNSKNEEEISDLKHKKKTLDADVAKAELAQSDFKNKIAKTEMEMTEVKKALVEAESLYEEKVKTIENELESIKVQTVNTENQYKILKILLEEEYVKTNYYSIMKAIEQPGVDSAEKLARASACGIGEVKDALSALNDRGVLKYDPSTGEYNVLMELNV